MEELITTGHITENKEPEVLTEKNIPVLAEEKNQHQKNNKEREVSVEKNKEEEKRRQQNKNSKVNDKNGKEVGKKRSRKLQSKEGTEDQTKKGRKADKENATDEDGVNENLTKLHHAAKEAAAYSILEIRNTYQRENSKTKEQTPADHSKTRAPFPSNSSSIRHEPLPSTSSSTRLEPLPSTSSSTRHEPLPSTSSSTRHEPLLITCSSKRHENLESTSSNTRHDEPVQSILYNARHETTPLTLSSTRHELIPTTPSNTSHKPFTSTPNYRHEGLLSTPSNTRQEPILSTTSNSRHEPFPSISSSTKDVRHEPISSTTSNTRHEPIPLTPSNTRHELFPSTSSNTRHEPYRPAFSIETLSSSDTYTKQPSSAFSHASPSSFFTESYSSNSSGMYYPSNSYSMQSPSTYLDAYPIKPQTNKLELTSSYLHGAYNTIYGERDQTYANERGGSTSSQCHSCCQELSLIKARMDILERDFEKMKYKKRSQPNIQNDGGEPKENELSYNGKTVAELEQIAKNSSTMKDAIKSLLFALFSVEEMTRSTVMGHRNIKSGDKVGLNEEKRSLMERLLSTYFEKDPTNVRSKIRDRLKQIRRQHLPVENP